MSSLSSANEKLATMVAAIPWIIGIVLAEGFWSTLFAFIIPFWAWYLTAEKYLQMIGWIQ